MNSLNTLLQAGYSKPLHRGEDKKNWQARISASQLRIIEAVTHNVEATDTLRLYVTTGDLASLPSDEHAMLTKLVTQCKAQCPNESQAKRMWPRKIASVIVSR